MGKKTEQTQETADFQTCTFLMNSIEQAAQRVADCGAAFSGRHWLSDSEESAKVAEIYKDSVHALRAAFRKMSEAEAILQKAAEQSEPVAPPGFFARVFSS
jgi:hypothetical protein